MKKINSYIFAALAVAGLAGCQAEVLVENVPAEVGTHTVSFIAGQEDTKTSMEISSGVVNFGWTATDANNFTIYENGIEATDNTGVLDGDVMSITAEFANTDATTFRYDAYLNGGVPADQSCTAVTYDSSADVLVAKTVNATAAETDFTFQFKRVVAIGQMTIKGMEDGEAIESVVISSDKDITGDFALDPANDFAETWSNGGKTITLTPSSTITVASGKAVVNFVTLPVEGAQLEITVTTDKSTYSKTFASTISFSEGRVKTFGVTVEKERVITFEYADHVGWTVDAVDKSSSSCFVLATGTSIVTPVFSFEQINKIEITQRTYGGASNKTVDVCLGGSEIASITAANTTLTKYSTETSPVYSTETADAQLVFKAAEGCSTASNGPGVSVIKVYYYGSDPILPVSHSITIDDEIANGSVEAGAASAYEGDEISLTATPADGYAFESWTVTNAATSEAITVTNDKFEMPDADVLVSATFVVSDELNVTYNFNDKNAYPTGFPTSGSSYATAETFVISGYPIVINAPNSYYTINSTSDATRGLFFGKSASSLSNSTAYLGFPARSGYKLTTVKATTTSGVAGSVSINIYDTDWNSMSTSVSTAASTKKEFTFDLTGSEANTEYRLAASTSGKNLQFDKIVLTYVPGENPGTKYVISIPTVSGGTLSASPSRAKEGDEVTLSATPDAEYVFDNNWSVTDSDNIPITVTNGVFTMPAKDVTVSASFSKKTYAITKTPSTNGTFSVKIDDVEVTSASKGDHVALECTPADGYILEAWSVVKASSGYVTVSDNAFTMPGEGVTVSVTFKEKPAPYSYVGSGTESDPYTLADVIHYIDELGGSTSTEEVCVSGVVSQVDSYNSTYKSITYWLGTGSEIFEVYSGLGNDSYPFTSKNSLAVGDEVIVKGYVKKYGDTYEFDKNNTLVSITKAPYLTATPSKSTAAAAGETITITVDTNIDGWTVSSSDNTNFAVVKTNSTTATVTVAANTGDARDATITVSATGVDPEEITLTQSAGGGSTISWVLVTDASSLAAGDVIKLGCAAKGKAAGAMGDYPYFTSKDAEISNGVLTCDEAIEITLGGSAGAWTLTTSEGQITTSAAKAIKIADGTQKTWTISVTSTGVATITGGSWGYIQFNASSPRFVNYTSAQTGIEIYKKTVN